MLLEAQTHESLGLFSHQPRWLYATGHTLKFMNHIAWMKPDIFPQSSYFLLLIKCRNRPMMSISEVFYNLKMGFKAAI